MHTLQVYTLYLLLSQGDVMMSGVLLQSRQSPVFILFVLFSILPQKHCELSSFTGCTRQIRRILPACSWPGSVASLQGERSKMLASLIARIVGIPHL